MSSIEAPSPSPKATAGQLSASDKHCVFRCGTSWFSVPATSIREISIAPALVSVPNSHPALAGMCHLRSEFLPVISLSSLPGIDALDVTQPHNKLLVINSGGSTWALSIAEAASIESLETLVSPESRSDDFNPTPVMGTATFRDQIVRVLDPNGIVRLVGQLLDERWHHDQTNSPLKM